jgi:predicted enzyme related to lactoylglutathione lyase
MVVLYVHDMRRAVTFYRDGVGLPVAVDSPGFSILACGDAIVGLHIIDGTVEERPVPYAGLNLQVDALEPAVERSVAHGATLTAIREPTRPGLPRLACLLDTEGNGFELRQPV